MTLIDMLEKNVRQCPNKIAIIYSKNKITYKEVNDISNRLSNSFLEIGLKKGDRVGLVLPRIPELVLGFLALSKAQGIAVPVNFELPDEKTRDVIESISPRFLIVHVSFLDLIRRSIPSTLQIPIVVVDKDDKENLSWNIMIKEGKGGSPGLTINDDDVFYLNYTSGSTGTPKGAITTYSNTYWNTIASVDALGLTPDDVHLCMFAPFAHPHEIFARPIYLGGTIIMIDRLYPKSIAEAIDKHKVTCMMGLAPMYENLLNLLTYKQYDLSSLRIAESGGMYTRPNLIDRFRWQIGIPLTPVWGSTETTGIAIANRQDNPVNPGSIGRPCNSYEVKIVDEKDNELSAGEIGELIFKGPAVVKGYYEDTIIDHSCFRDGWYYSGDLGKKDDEGNFYFVERKTGMMKVAGLKVFPLEIEQILMNHPSIRDAAVIAVKNRLRGEIPKAIIVKENGTELTEKMVIEFCRKSLPNYKLPRIVEMRDSLPKIVSGKINKKELQMEHI